MPISNGLAKIGDIVRVKSIKPTPYEGVNPDGHLIIFADIKCCLFNNQKPNIGDTYKVTGQILPPNYIIDLDHLCNIDNYSYKNCPIEFEIVKQDKKVKRPKLAVETLKAIYGNSLPLKELNTWMKIYEILKDV